MKTSPLSNKLCFNPCFNGSMYKNVEKFGFFNGEAYVSILVLMDLCIKTKHTLQKSYNYYTSFNPCFNGSMYKNWQ